jgi:hypothetical protein
VTAHRIYVLVSANPRGSFPTHLRQLIDLQIQ